MSKRRLVVTAVLAGSSQSEVARLYGVSQGWVSKLMARYRAEGEAAFAPRSRAPVRRPTATPAGTVELVLRLRKDLAGQGLDAGADTIGWHLLHHHQVNLSRATVHRILTRRGQVVPAPAKRPKASYIRFAADLPNGCWQADFTHYRLAGLAGPQGRPGPDVEVLSWIDDHSRFALHVSAHQRVTGPIVRDSFREAIAEHGIPASTLTDNGMVFTTRLAGGRGGRNALEHELWRLGVVQKNSRPNHPTTCGKVERFQQTLKKWLRAQPDQPTTLAGLQALLETFVTEYNTRRPHRSLPHRATPATAYAALPKATPAPDGRGRDSHDRVRRDRIDATGVVTLRLAGRLHHIGIGRTHARTHVILLIHDHHVRVIAAATGELLRDLVIDPTRDYQPTGRPPGPTRTQQ